MSSKLASRNRENSYIDHIIHIQNIPNPEQIQYMNYTHSIAWTFNKDKKCNYKLIIFYLKMI